MRGGGLFKFYRWICISVFDILLDDIMIYARHVLLTDVSLWFVNKRKTFRGSCQLMLAFILFQVLYIPNGSHIDLGCLVNIIENLNIHQRKGCPNEFQLRTGNLNNEMFRTLTLSVYGDDMNDTLLGIKIFSLQSYASGGNWSINHLIAVIVVSLAIFQSILNV